MRTRIVGLLALAVLTLINMSAAFADRPLFQLPFTCGQQWKGDTYDGHSPNNNSIDFMIYPGGADASYR